MSVWVAIGVTAVGCYAVKLLGLLVPAGALERPLVRRLAALLPVALLAALTAQQTFADGQALVLDAGRRGSARPPWRWCCAHRSCSSSPRPWW